MAVTQYIGSRYVPLFADPLDWDITKQYEPLTIVYYQGNSFTSKQSVPANIDITNTDYWAITGNYNAQIENYRREVAAFDGRITANAQAIADEVTARMAEDTAIRGIIDDLQGSLDDEISARESADTQIRTDFAAADTQIRTDFTAADTQIANNLNNFKYSGGPSTLAGCNYLGTIPYLSASDIATWEHAGSVCSNGEYEVMISCPIPQPEDNTGTVRFVSVKNNTANVIAPKTVKLGHANSITYYAPDNEYYITPTELMENGSYIQTNEIYVYNSNFTQRRVIAAPGVPTGISCDPVTNKIYVEIPDQNDNARIYELSGTTFTLIGTIDSRSVEGGFHVQDLAVYNGVWFMNNTIGNFVYGDISPFTIRGTFDIARHCTTTEYKLFGEVDGCDFTPDGHLLCSGDSGLAAGGMSYGYIHTIFEILYPTSKVAPIYVDTVHNNIAHATQIIDGDFSRLRQCGPFAAPQLTTPMINVIGTYLRANFTADINTGPICFSPFSKTSLFLNGHTFTTPFIRIDNELIVMGSGTFKANQLAAQGTEMINASFQGNVTVDSDTPDSYWGGARTGSVINVGSISNPKNIKFPGSNIVMGGSTGTGTYFDSSNVYTNRGIIPQS